MTGRLATPVGRHAGTKRRVPCRLAYALLGVAAFSVFLIVRAPASLIAGVAGRASQGTISIDAPAGTVWSGSGQLVAAQAAQGPVPIGRVAWAINPLWLFAGKVGIHFAVSGGGVDLAGHVRAGFGSVALMGVRGAFPARLIPLFYAPAELLGPDGAIEITTPDLRWSRKNGIAGIAEIHWRDAASTLTTVRPLGDYRLSLDQGGELELDTLRGDLRLSGQGMLDNTAGSVRFSGQASAGGRVQELVELLKLIGPGPDAGPRPFHVEILFNN